MGRVTAAIALAAVWLVLAGAVEPAEFACAAVAIACTLVTVHRGDPEGLAADVFALRPAAFAGAAAAALVKSAIDSLQITGAILRAALGGRRAAGSIVEEPLRLDVGSNARSRRAASVTLVSFPPNTTALEVDGARSRIQAHRLVRERR